MHPAAQQPPQNRSCPSPSVAQCPSPSPSLIQQQQHVLYGPITTLQPCPASLHPHCVYTGVQRNPGLSGAAPLTNQGKWQPKSKPSRGHHHPQQQQYCQSVQQQHLQQQQPLAYIPKPLVLFDQCPANQSTSGGPPSATSFLVASSTLGHAPYGLGDQYSSASGLTLIPQPYFKPPDVPQAFCLLPERTQPSQHHQQQLVGQNQASYYNISTANTCSIQTINPKSGYQLTNLSNPCASIAAFGNSQICTGQAAPTSQIFQNPPVTVTFGAPSRDKLSMVSDVDLQALTCSRNLALADETKIRQYALPRSENVEWPVQNSGETANAIFEIPDSARSPQLPSSPIHTNQLNSSTFTKNQDEHYSDESAASFDFTIEAEKMVSALCNTVSSKDLVNDENRDGNATSPSFSGAAGDNVTNKTNIWFADFCAEYGVTVGENYRAASTQTQEDRDDSQQYTESMRKTIYWGCDEAEGVLSSENYRGTSRTEWLANVCCATRTAVTKSSTCFPIYSGDRTFVQDLINAHLRISNGWLVLDNYLNKQQHYPSLSQKFDGEFTDRFRSWEVVTHDLLREIVNTFVKIDENSGSSNSVSSDQIGRQENMSGNSFPGDVSLYVNYDLLDSSQRYQETVSRIGNAGRIDRDSTYTLRYAPVRSFEAAQQSQKETKLRSKWTITENLSSTIDGTKSIPDNSLNQSEYAYSTGNRFRAKNTSNSSAAKISTSGRHSLNAEFVHLRNTVMESMGNCSELERQRWGMKESQYDFVFGASGAASTVSGSNDPILKIKTTGSAYENAYTRGYVPRINSTNLVNQSTTAECSGVYLVTGAEAAMDTTYIAADRKVKNYAEPDYTGTGRMSECAEYNCASGLVVSATSVSSSVPDPVYAGKCSSGQRELATVPRTKMTLLSQIEGNSSTTNKDPKEMTANLSAWFASMRNSTGHRTIDCPVEGRKSEKTTVVTRTSTHPQETSRSAMDLNRQLHMDGNRQLAALQNMQTIQSQPWNACNLLNNKRSNAKVRHADEYDSSEDVRVYMKPGSYNVPKKRHNRKNTRRTDNPGSSRINNHTPRSHTSRGPAGGTYNSSGGKNHHGSSSIGSLTIVSSVQVSTTTTNTSTTLRVPFPATPIVPPPADFGMECSTRILRRVRSVSNQETRQDVAWKAACASAEILLEALNVKETEKADRDESKSVGSTKELNDRQDLIADRSTDKRASGKSYRDDFCAASSCEASDDDSDSTCKLSPRSDLEPDPRDAKQQRTNVKTDSWLIRTLNNASIVSKIDAVESDDDSTVGETLKNSTRKDRREHQKVVTSTPEQPKVGTESSAGCNIVARNLNDSFREASDSRSPPGGESRERSASNDRQPISVSLVDNSREFIGRATYSETVRRSNSKTCSASKKDSCRSRQTRSSATSVPAAKSCALPAAGRKSQRKENDKTYQVLHKSRKTVVKRMSRDLEDKDIEDCFGSKKIVKEDSGAGSTSRPFAVKTQVKKKPDNGACAGLLENKFKTSDRGWSVWYSSRRRQSLSPIALNKLSTIHQTLWQMDGAQIFKYPSADSSVAGSLTGTIEDYCRVVKNPMFLETIGYKLKNRIYHKANHVVRDFRKIINNSKLYHKNDTDRTAKIEILSKKLEDLFEEHFDNWDLDNVSDSPRDDDGSSVYKSPQQRKSAVSRLPKKNPAVSAKNEN